MIRNICAAILVIIIVLLMLYPLAHAQVGHDRHHVFYQNWTNQKDTNCCNNQDCGELPPENERVTSNGVEVKIEGVWCPVYSWHYLKKGNAPNWAVAHVCVQRAFQSKTSACSRLLCYQPKPGS